jgi:coenzyme F420-0:L-glutamate ligase/coenzyme F420-1:gamma-L-glutamate ligase
MADAMDTTEYTVTGVTGVPQIRAGDNLGVILAEALSKTGLGRLVELDVVVVASKVVSISEGRRVDLASVEEVSAEAQNLSLQIGKDARLVELILRESTKHRLATLKGPIIARHKLGFELTSAGVDNAGEGGAYLLPANPDQSAKELATQLKTFFKVERLGVVVVDSDGRPDRAGATVVAIGSWGFEPLRRTHAEVSGRKKIQEETIVDMIAAAAGIVIGQRGRGIPFAIVRGVNLETSSAGLQSILHQ